MGWHMCSTAKGHPAAGHGRAQRETLEDMVLQVMECIPDPLLLHQRHKGKEVAVQGGGSPAYSRPSARASSPSTRRCPPGEPGGGAAVLPAQLALEAGPILAAAPLRLQRRQCGPPRPQEPREAKIHILIPLWEPLDMFALFRGHLEKTCPGPGQKVQPVVLLFHWDWNLDKPRRGS
uniref:Uncharacterized protein n=1 Tax=Pipistrellus kuhlii TaxID=59472 RepID=A0A7J7X120_PIPKU|nr:hypothetical protein mPipKuh1_010788 [Pipistrellus kuhlii]